jgi:hypothetical protein
MRGEKKEGTLITVAWNVSEVTRFGSVLEGVETGLRQADSHLKTPPISQTRGLVEYWVWTSQPTGGVPGAGLRQGYRYGGSLLQRRLLSSGVRV